jgi:DNA-binding response OmpR family regulator
MPAAVPPRVLVVDDDPQVAGLYAEWLADDYRVTTADGGEAALDAIEELDRVDAVLLDRRMPDLAGDLVLVLLRDRGIDCPVAMVTAVEPDVDVVSLGFDDYLTKPAERAELRETVDVLVSLDSVDDLTRELSRLRVKRNVLRVELSPREEERSAVLGDLERRIERLERRLEAPAGPPMVAD